MLLTPVLIIHHATKYGKVWLLALPCQPISCQESITKTSEKGEKHFSWDFSFLSILYLVIESLSGLEPSKKVMLAGQKAPGTHLSSLLKCLAYHCISSHRASLCALGSNSCTAGAGTTEPCPSTPLLQQTAIYGYANPKGKVFPTSCAWDLDISPQESSFWP